MSKDHALLLAITGLLASQGVEAQLPVVETGGSVFIYAPLASFPGSISFDAFDNLYVGNFNNQGLPNVEAHVWVVDAGDSSVSSCAFVEDPDAVYVDRNGLFSAPGTLLVGGLIDGSVPQTGRIYGVANNCGPNAILATGGCVHNVFIFAEDALGNLYIANATARTVCRWNGAAWTPFLAAFATDPSIAVDGTDIYISSSGTVQRYDLAGNLVDPAFAAGMVRATGPAGSVFEGIIVTRGDTLMVAVDPDTKVESPILTGPKSSGYVAFDSSNDLYLAQNMPTGGTGRVLHVTQGSPVTSSGPTPLALGVVSVVPNPFNPEAAIRFTLPSRTVVTAEIWSVHGRRVRTLAHERSLGAGAIEMRWDGTNDDGQSVASGIYFVRVKSSLGERVARAVLLK